MKRGIIITLPRYDYVTEYLSSYSNNIVKISEEKQVKVKKIMDNQVTKKEVENIINSLDYNFIIFNGHGSSDSIEGQHETIIKAEINHNILKNRIIYARVCNSAEILGRECVKDSDISCYIGYKKSFQFYVNKKWIGNPLKDKTASLFLETSNQIPISLIKGNNAKEADNISKNLILKSINKILRDQTEESYLIAYSLWNNYINQIVLGNQKAVI